MRISSLQIYNTGISNMMSAQAQSSKTQEQISSGKRVLRPSDDPVASAQIQQLHQDSALREQYQSNIKRTKNSLDFEDSILNGVTDSLQRIRELVLQANSGSTTLSDRKSIAQELKNRSQELLGMANTRDANGEYIFSGFKGDTPAFYDDGTGTVRFQGDEGQRFVQIASSTFVESNDSGKSVFVDIPSSRNSFTTGASPLNKSVPPATISAGFVLDQDAYDKFYPNDMVIEFQPPSSVVPARANFNIIQRSDGRVLQSNVLFDSESPIVINGAQFSIKGSPQEGDTFFVNSSANMDMMTNVNQLVEGLNSIGDAATDGDRLQKLVNKALANIDNAMTSVLSTRGKIGGRLNTIDSTDLLHQDTQLVSDKLLSDIESLDYTKAVSQLTFQNFVLEAAQSSFAKISNLSLFDKI